MSSADEAYVAEKLSLRAEIFRRNMVDEFRVEELLNFEDAPKLSTHDLFSEEIRETEEFRSFLKSNPEQLVKFKIFKRDPRSDENTVSVRQIIDKRMIRVENMNKVPWGAWAHWLSEHTLFNLVIFLLIMVNAVIQGLQTGMSKEADHAAFEAMDILDDITIVVFTLEIGVKWVDSFWLFWGDGWNVFDFVITVLSVVPRIVEAILGGGANSSFSTLSNQLRLFRTLRILKMVARLRSLRVVINTVIEAFYDLGFMILLLFLLMYMFGIFAMNLFLPYTESDRDDLIYQDKFESLFKSFASLFQILTLDQWYVVQQDIQKVIAPWVCIIFFVVWVWIGAFIFSNVFVGVMVRKFDEMTQELEKEAEEQRRLKKNRERMKMLDQELQEEKHAAESEAAENTMSDAPSAQTNRQQIERLRQAQADMKRKQERSLEWLEEVQNSLVAIADMSTNQGWPRDTLFRYMSLLGRLQHNIKEYQRLQLLAAAALHNVCEWKDLKAR